MKDGHCGVDRKRFYVVVSSLLLELVPLTIIPKKIFHLWQQGLAKLSQHLQQNLASQNRSFCPNLL
jgi:hypothetical protein